MIIPQSWHPLHLTPTHFVVELGSASSAHHLQDVGDGEIDVSLGFAIVILRSFDDNQMGGEIDAPRQRRSRDQNLHHGENERVMMMMMMIMKMMMMMIMKMMMIMMMRLRNGKLDEG